MHMYYFTFVVQLDVYTYTDNIFGFLQLKADVLSGG